MKMKGLLFLAMLTFFLVTDASFAAKVCLQEGKSNIIWELKGGRVDRKSYIFKRVIPGSCTLSGFAEVTSKDSDSFTLGALSGWDATGTCDPPVLWSATIDENFEGAGSYDVYADGIMDGFFGLTRVNCSLLP